MNNISPENSFTSTDNRSSPNADARKQSPPAFLDLADSAARLGTNMSDISARVELKRLEHERQRLLQRQMFENQMRVLEQQQAQELLTIPFSMDASSPNGVQHIAVSAPTTPPRVNTALNGDSHAGSGVSPVSAGPHQPSPTDHPLDKSKGVSYNLTINLSPDSAPAAANGHSFARPAMAKSMPASRRTSTGSHDEELASHLQGLSLAGEHPTRRSPALGPVSASVLTVGSTRFGEESGTRSAGGLTAGMMLDEQLDQEMHNAMRHLPTSDDDRFNAYANKVSSSSAALDLAHRLQSSPLNRALDTQKVSEWPHFTGSPNGESVTSRADRRASGTPSLTLSDLSKLSGSASASSTPFVSIQHPQTSSPHIQLPTSRRASPHITLEGLVNATRSVPTTPLAIPNTTAHMLKSPGTPMSADKTLNILSSTPGSDSSVVAAAATATDLQASLSRLPGSDYENGPASASAVSALDFTTIQPGMGDPLQYGVNSVYGGLDGNRYGAYGYEQGVHNTTGSTALYHHNGTRYGLGIPRPGAGPDGKMSGLHGPKHKRGDMDRDFNRFAGTRLEDLAGEIPALCKDQHGCRYLQKKLEEGVPEHRDMIFRETFGHFADLMTVDPFGNYLCQKLLEFSTDEQRNVICESVAQDLVTISLNMHGTRAVQKMIDFLSTRRQAGIHSIIVALSLHVVVLIKDLNGNHVIQKCLNKLAPEDNQFIYNAVAANCVEVATHRHGCCVLQRCIDHASDHQRIQLVNEITYNALTLVQDPYGNYVVQYILDLNDSRFSDAVIRQFMGNVCALSVQKFSSNVIEKCIRVAEHNTRKLLIEELLNRTRLEKLLRDSYGNYCVQTALDYAEPGQRTLLVEGIRPVLPLIRNTPYGKRIQNKLQREQMDHYGGGYNQQALASILGNASMGVVPPGASRIPPGLRASPLSHVSSLHGLHPSSIDGYVMQGNSAAALSGTHSGVGYGTVGGSFGAANGFGNAAGLSSGAFTDSYQRSAFGYTM
ncbi:ARM repeat-containing protein [Fistulina hepatica ATCC 64428]|uniref:ARM repeat-containing protein n=1 Tax=Fistulina hepatica ATCC 64428 TaxID=1128425 RepID=A0A0D7A371_9AGAR|nr:ARM repeat-containing protein [Fistulina hepatica ATCC 64428]